MAFQTLGEIEQSLLSDSPRLRFVVPGLLPAGPCLLYGSSGSGKTGLSIRAAVAVAAGLHWADQAVSRGCVLYIAGEDVNGVRERMVAAALYLGLSPAIVPLAVMECPEEGLVSPKSRAEIESAARKLQKETGLPVALVVIDTLAACFGSKSQDDASAASEYMNNADRLAHNLGCCVLSVHHTGKNENSGMRGSRVFFDRADAVLNVKVQKNNTSSAQVEKMRNGTKGERFSFDISALDVPVYGGTISVQMVTQIKRLEAPERRDNDGQGEKRTDAATALDILIELVARGVHSVKAWQDACYAAWTGKTHNARKTAFSNAVKKLLKEGRITVSGDIVSVSVSEKPANPDANRASPDDVSVSVSNTPLQGGCTNAPNRPEGSPVEKPEGLKPQSDGLVPLIADAGAGESVPPFQEEETSQCQRKPSSVDEDASLKQGKSLEPAWT